MKKDKITELVKLLELEGYLTKETKEIIDQDINGDTMSTDIYLTFKRKRLLGYHQIGIKLI